MSVVSPSEFASFPSYHPLNEWLSSKSFDALIATMSVSAGSKKPGRVLERVKKKAGDRFKRLKVVKWEKAEKMVFGIAHTRGIPQNILALEHTNIPEGWLDEEMLFQTDLYLKTRNDHTEGNAVTVASMGESCFNTMINLNLSWTNALEAARLYAAGLDGAKISKNDAHVAIIPYEGGAMRAVTLPIERVEHGTKTLGHLLKIHDFYTAADVEDHRDELLLDEISGAMTKEGYPGPDAFGSLIRRNATPLIER